MVRTGKIRIEGVNKQIRGDTRVSAGNVVTGLAFKPLVEKRAKISLDVLNKVKNSVVFKNENIIVINKPYGVAVHSGTGTEHYLVPYLRYLRFGNAQDPFIVHRLDKTTTGCLIMGRHRQAAALLHARMKTDVDKFYYGVVIGVPAGMQGRIDAPLYYVTDLDAEYITTVKNSAWDSQGVFYEEKQAITLYRVVGTSAHKGERVSLVEFKPLTGRKHQIRVHAAEVLNAPIVGDLKYGGKLLRRKNAENGGGVCLHCYMVRICKSLFGDEEDVWVRCEAQYEFKRMAWECGFGDLKA